MTIRAICADIYTLDQKIRDRFDQAVNGDVSTVDTLNTDDRERIHELTMTLLAALDLSLIHGAIEDARAYRECDGPDEFGSGDPADVERADHYARFAETIGPIPTTGLDRCDRCGQPYSPGTSPHGWAINGRISYTHPFPCNH